MAEQFLHQLPRVRRGVLGKSDQRCFICMEDYGTVPSANGIIERAVRLPCGHIMGSECIAIWVSSTAGAGKKNNNTCPVCRHVLFENEHLPMSASWAEHMRIHTLLFHRCVSICAMIGLGPEVQRLARWFANREHDRVRLEERNNSAVVAVAAASVYMASHVLSDARSGELIASCVHFDVGVNAIRCAYTSLYSQRYHQVDQMVLARAGMEARRMDEVLPSSFRSEAW